MSTSHEWMHGYQDGKAGRGMLNWPNTGKGEEVADYMRGYEAGMEDARDEGLCEKCGAPEGRCDCD